jgi:hypothetical protein
MKRDYRFNAIDPNRYFMQSKDLDKEAKYEAKPLLRLGAPLFNNLAISTKAPRLLTAQEEAILILVAKFGVRPLAEYAASEVVIAHLPWIRAQACRRWDALNAKRHINNTVDLNPPKLERSARFDDFVATCAAALWEAIVQWRPSNNKLNAFARKFILGALSDIAADWRNKPGLQMDSRIQRVLRSHPYWAPK